MIFVTSHCALIRVLRHDDWELTAMSRQETGSVREEDRPDLSPINASYGQRFANWLNATKSSPEHRRVCEIMDALAALRTGTSGEYCSMSAVVQGRRFSGRMPREVAFDKEYSCKMRRLRKKLQRYVFAFNLHYPLSGYVWVGSLEPVGKRAPRSRFRLGEHDAVFWLFELATSGELERLRECDCGCGAWFFASRLDRRFVGDHRGKHYRQTPRFRNDHAEYMRHYRSREKQWDKTALTRARRLSKASEG
jgi:hypothetical protein